MICKNCINNERSEILWTKDGLKVAVFCKEQNILMEVDDPCDSCDAYRPEEQKSRETYYTYQEYKKWDSVIEVCTKKELREKLQQFHLDFFVGRAVFSVPNREIYVDEHPDTETAVRFNEETKRQYGCIF